MMRTITPRRVVDEQRQIMGSASTASGAMHILGEPVKLANVEWQPGEHGFQCPFIEQVWMPEDSALDAGVPQDLSTDLFARTIICKRGPNGHVSPMADSARGPMPDLPPLDCHGMDLRSGHDTAYYRVTDVPHETPIGEVARRLNKTAIWGVWEIPYRLLDDGRGTHWRFLTPKTVAAGLPANCRA